MAMEYMYGRQQRSFSARRRAFSLQTVHTSRTGSGVGAERPLQRLSKGLFAAAAAAAFSCAAVMLMFQADRHVAMPRGQELGHAGAAASVGEPQELCRR